MAVENSLDGERAARLNEEQAAQIQKLEAALASEKKRCADKDKQLQMMEALMGRLRSRLELLEDNLKEQQRKQRANSDCAVTVLDLQQQLAAELAKRKQTQYALIEKGQELCDIQERLAESQQRIKELLIAKSGEKVEHSHLTHSTHSTHSTSKKSEDHSGPSLSPAIVISGASPMASKGTGSFPHCQSPCSKASSYAPAVISPCATPKSPADFKQFFPLPPKMMVPPLTLPLNGENASEWQHRTLRADEQPHVSYSLEIPEQQIFLEYALPNTCHSGYHTPVQHTPVHFQPAPVEYPRILAARSQQENKKIAPSAKTARMISDSNRIAHVPSRGVPAHQSMPLARPLMAESPRIST